MPVLSAKDFGASVGRFVGCFNNNFVLLVTKEAYNSTELGNSLFGIALQTAAIGTVFGIVRLVNKEMRTNGALRLGCSLEGYWRFTSKTTEFYKTPEHGSLDENLPVYWIKEPVLSVLISDMVKPVQPAGHTSAVNSQPTVPLKREKQFQAQKLNLPTGTTPVPAVETIVQSDVLLMCKDIPVYNITKGVILNTDLLPGAMLRNVRDYSSWVKTRYSADSNVTARRLMLGAFGTDSHGERVLKTTRMLSLSDCYWLKDEDEDTQFNDVTPYLHKEWDGSGRFSGGSLATLFVNGAANKCWIDADTLKKFTSYKELEVYEFCEAIGVTHISEARLDGLDLLLTNFTSTDYFLEAIGQSGYSGMDDYPFEKGIEIFGELAVSLFVVDYLVESDDRHAGNFGFIRNANTGEYVSMAPFYDFDRAFCGNSTALPEMAFTNHRSHIKALCDRAKSVAAQFEHCNIILKCADELLALV